jgi:hypothetical protein
VDNRVTDPGRDTVPFVGDRYDTRNLWFWLLSALGVLALCIIAAVGWSAKSTSFWAQLIGSTLTFIGLLVAYMRAKHPGDTLAAHIRGFVLRLVCKQTSKPTPIGQASGTYAFRGGVIPDRGFRHDRDLDLQAQIDDIVGYLNDDLVREAVAVGGRLDELKAETARTAGLADERSAEAYQKAKAQIDELKRELDRSAALDLRWAIFGLYVATIGVALSWWS